MARVSEFDLIERYFAPLACPLGESVLTSTGDDCAVILPPPQTSICFSIDTMVEGVHFPKGAPPFELAYRSLAAAMSDLAAMGSTPAFFTLALTLPDTDSIWLEDFSSGLKVLVDQFQFPLLGGDTTRGPLTISIQAHGFLSKPALLRSGAKDGDILAVSGTLGDAGAALDLLSVVSCKEKVFDSGESYLLSRYYRPSPRIALGQILLGCATSCIDISDGLLAEAEHICKKSSVSIIIDSALIPLSSELLGFKGVEKAQELALTAGDDYELLFTVPESKWSALVASLPVGAVTEIGKVQAGSGVQLDGMNGKNLRKGFQHFE
jgi:thiamine-monophosphate kinase